MDYDKQIRDIREDVSKMRAFVVGVTSDLEERNAHLRNEIDAVMAARDRLLEERGFMESQIKELGSQLEEMAEMCDRYRKGTQKMYRFIDNFMEYGKEVREGVQVGFLPGEWEEAGPSEGFVEKVMAKIDEFGELLGPGR